MITPTNAFAPERSVADSLNIRVGKGILWLSGVQTIYATVTVVPMVANTFNYVFINGANGAIQSNTSGFISTFIPIATVLTGNNSVLTITDNRPDFFRLSGLPGSNFAETETPTGLINSSNTTYTLAHTPILNASLGLYLNGLLQQAGGGDFTLSGTTITFVIPPSTGDHLIAFYRY